MIEVIEIENSDSFRIFLDGVYIGCIGNSDFTKDQNKAIADKISQSDELIEKLTKENEELSAAIEQMKYCGKDYL